MSLLLSSLKQTEHSSWSVVSEAGFWGLFLQTISLMWEALWSRGHHEQEMLSLASLCKCSKGEVSTWLAPWGPPCPLWAEVAVGDDKHVNVKIEQLECLVGWFSGALLFLLEVSHLEWGEHAVSREFSRNVLLNFSLHKITLQQTSQWVASVETQSGAVPKITPKCVSLCKTSEAQICGWTRCCLNY